MQPQRQQGKSNNHYLARPGLQLHVTLCIPQRDVQRGEGPCCALQSAGRAQAILLELASA